MNEPAYCYALCRAYACYTGVRLCDRPDHPNNKTLPRAIAQALRG